MQFLLKATWALLSKAPFLFLFPDDTWFYMTAQIISAMQGMLKAIPYLFRLKYQTNLEVTDTGNSIFNQQDV